MTSTYIFTALLWGSIGFGFFIYGKKQKKIVPLVGGILLMGISYAVRTQLNLSLVSVAIIAGIVVARKMM
ncbi:amino acid transport protein [Candidatus Latescibacterota bacterium]